MPDDAKLLGSITYQGRVYTLGSDGSWTGPGDGMVQWLNEEFPPFRHTTACDAVLPAGYETVAAAAKAYGDPSPTLPSFRPSAPGTVH